MGGKCEPELCSTGLYRMHYSDAEKDERLVLRMMSRAERDKRKADERTDKERQRDENRFLREKAREAARWAALHPQDDLEVPAPHANSRPTLCSPVKLDTPKSVT